MKKKTVYIILFFLSVLLTSNTLFEAVPATKARDQFLSSIDNLQRGLAQFKKMVEEGRDGKSLQDEFKKLRIAYKKCELFLSYFSPLTESSMNGPNIHSVEEERFPEEESPHGFQVIEEILFPSVVLKEKNQLVNEIDRLTYNIDQFLRFKKSFVFNEQFAFDAMEQQLVRIAVLGITGFDSPVLNYSLEEASVGFTIIKENLKLYTYGSSRKSARWQSLMQKLDQSIAVLKKAKDFNSFDRLAFIKNEAIPLYGELVKFREERKIPSMTGVRATRQSAYSFWSPGFFDINYFSLDKSNQLSKGKIILGKKLFNDPLLSGNGQRSCASCHNPHKGFSDGLAKSFNVDESTHTQRNAPTLFNAGYQTFFFLDMRARSLEAQLDTVLNNKLEMGTTLGQVVSRLANNPEYVRMFSSYFAEKNSISGSNLKRALAAYIRSLQSLNSPFDQYMVRSNEKIDQSVYNGFNLFMGKAKCGTCHFAPLFNGLVPPRFVRMESEVIGVPSNTDTLHPKLDPDLGRFGILPVKVVRNAFKTTSVRNIELTAPYMHNGVYSTLEEVIDFYNRGGGAGLGIAPEHQTLPFDKLNLVEKEKKDLIAFLKSLTDTSSILRY